MWSENVNPVRPVTYCVFWMLPRCAIAFDSPVSLHPQMSPGMAQSPRKPPPPRNALDDLNIKDFM